ncbi:TPA: hypothetical protein ACTLYC_002726, partial [Staphylococcus aureus]
AKQQKESKVKEISARRIFSFE